MNNAKHTEQPSNEFGGLSSINHEHFLELKQIELDTNFKIDMLLMVSYCW